MNIIILFFLSNGVTPACVQDRPHRGFTIVLRPTTLGRTPLDGWQNTTFTTDRHPCPGRIRTRNPSKRAAVDVRPKLRVKLIILHSLYCTSRRSHACQFLLHWPAPHNSLSRPVVKQTVFERDKPTKTNACSNNSNHFATKEIYLLYYPDQQMHNIYITNILYNIYILYILTIYKALFIYIYVVDFWVCIINCTRCTVHT
jgi:hypothetical protein